MIKTDNYAEDYNLTINENTADKLILVDVDGQAFNDSSLHASAQKNLLSPLNIILTQTMPQAEIMPQYKVGYVTKAGLVYAGVGEKNEHIYTTQQNMGVMNWYEANAQIDEINNVGEYKEEYGEARFPSGSSSKQDELCNNFYKNRDIVSGLKVARAIPCSNAGYDANSDAAIWGQEGLFGPVVQYFDDLGPTCTLGKEKTASLRPVWSTKCVLS